MSPSLRSVGVHFEIGGGEGRRRRRLTVLGTWNFVDGLLTVMVPAMEYLLTLLCS